MTASMWSSGRTPVAAAATRASSVGEWPRASPGRLAALVIRRSLVARQQLCRRAPTGLPLEIDVGERARCRRGHKHCLCARRKNASLQGISARGGDGVIFHSISRPSGWCLSGRGLFVVFIARLVLAPLQPVGVR